MSSPSSVIIESVRGSDIPVQLIYVEMIDGVYAPIGLRTPPGPGPFPLVLFTYGNGGGGMAVVREFTQNVSYTQEQFLQVGYAVAWLRYRAEVDYAYDKIGKLIEDKRQGRQLLNRGPLEYEDVIAIAEYVKTLPMIAGDRVGFDLLQRLLERRFAAARNHHLGAALRERGRGGEADARAAAGDPGDLAAQFTCGHIAWYRRAPRPAPC